MIEWRRYSGQWTRVPGNTAAGIIRARWQRMRATHRIRIVR